MKKIKLVSVLLVVLLALTLVLTACKNAKTLFLILMIVFLIWRQ